MEEFEKSKKRGKAKKFFIFAFLTAIVTAIATLFMKKKKEGLSEDEDEILGLSGKKSKKK